MPDNSNDDPQVTNKLRKDWNDYTSWLAARGLKGNPSLDKGGLGYKYFDDYIKQNPTTSLSRDTMPIVRKELLNYRQWVLDEDKKPANVRRGELDKKNGVTEENFMRVLVNNEKTQDPNLPGTFLTQVKFPDEYVKLKGQEGYGTKLGFVNTTK